MDDSEDCEYTVDFWGHPSRRIPHHMTAQELAEVTGGSGAAAPVAALDFSECTITDDVKPTRPGRRWPPLRH